MLSIEKYSIRDGERGISGIDICHTVDLKFIGGSRNCGGRVYRLLNGYISRYS